MKRFIIPMTLCCALQANAYEARYTKGQKADLASVLKDATDVTGVEFKEEGLVLIEDRELATSHFRMWVQGVRGIPVQGTAVRVWTDLTDGSVIQIEAKLAEKVRQKQKSLEARFDRAHFSKAALGSSQLKQAIESIVAKQVGEHPSDTRVLGMKARDEWRGDDLVRVVEVRSRRGTHKIAVSLLKSEVVEQSYNEFQPADQFQNLKANVYSIYEEVESTNQLLNTVESELKYVDTSVPVVTDDPFAPMRTRIYPESRYSSLFALIPQGRAAGYWAPELLRLDAEKLVEALPQTDNETSILLRGKYTNINLHPDAKAAFPGVTFPLAPSASYLGVWNRTATGYVLTPTAGLSGKVHTADEIAALLPVRLPDHDATTYLNAGFDEIQVYYAVTTLMDALNEMGLTDPEFSTRPFEAFLYDPDIGMRDNAYYNDNTINFTTYSAKSGNMARDNSTIWHELGHGIMDRLMGPHITLADTGGLSEGMADFVAMLVIQHQTDNADFPGKDDFRIINKTGFHLTNEVHDDGEAYGGTMKDIQDAFIAAEGRDGNFKMADLTMETMRLTRNHPGLTAEGWFSHMLFADEIGSKTRAPGAYKALILKALAGRNFSFSSATKSADLVVKVGGNVLDSRGPGSRENAIPACSESGKVHYDLDVSLEQGDDFQFQYPVRVEVEFQRHALQGAIAWDQEVNNPVVYTLNSPEDMITVPLDASMKCEAVNQPDGSCKDYAYVQIFNNGETKPRAKKRFYLRIQDGATQCN